MIRSRAAQTVPFFRNRNNNIRLFQRFHIWGSIPGKFNHGSLEGANKPSIPVCDSFLDKCLHWSNIYNFSLWSFTKRSPHGELCSNSFSTTGRRSQKAILITPKKLVEYLRLNGIEVFKSSTADRFQDWVLKGCYRKRLALLKHQLRNAPAHPTSL